MDMDDFKYNQKYKIILPIIYIFNWVLMLTGPFAYPIVYQFYTLALFCYLAIKTILNLGWCIIGVTNGVRLLKKYHPDNNI
jgi:hypothetical protein